MSLPFTAERIVWDHTISKLVTNGSSVQASLRSRRGVAFAKEGGVQLYVPTEAFSEPSEIDEIEKPFDASRSSASSSRTDVPRSESQEQTPP